MKKYKKLITSILAFILAITALPGSAPVYAADQVYVDDADLAGTVIKVADNGAEPFTVLTSIWILNPAIKQSMTQLRKCPRNRSRISPSA